MNAALWYLLTTTQIKHFLCDYPFQKHGAKKGDLRLSVWVPDLLAHSAVHMVGTVSVFWPIVGLAAAWNYGVVDLLAHFLVDRIKAHPQMGGRWKPQDKLFWVALGADQMVHHLINLLFVWHALLRYT